MQEKKFSKVTIKETNETKKVPVGSDLNPEVSDELIEKWQSLLDVTARIIDVPAASIMKLHKDHIEVFLNSQTAENPLYAGQKIELIYGVYCETTIGEQQKLLVNYNVQCKTVIIMGKYLNSKYNNRVELYLMIEGLDPKEFNGHRYMLWNDSMIRLFKKEKGLSKEARLTDKLQDEYTKWLEKKMNIIN